MKQKVYETGGVSTLQEMKSFFILIRGLFPVIDEFISTHKLINERITDNECFSISFGTRKTTLFLNTDIIA